MMLSRSYWALCTGLLCACFALAPATVFGQWSERTELTFSSPVMVPGVTLPAGTYVFQLMDPGSAGDIIEIRRKDGTLITTTMTVPTKRQEPKGDTVLKFNPTEPGAAPALAAWFYPGSVYGHQFVYSDDQAKSMAQRTKTVVLSGDVSGSSQQKATLRVYDASGVAQPWKPDADAQASWQQWSKSRPATARVMSGTTKGERAEATAPMVDAKFQGTRVTIGALEENPRQYTGKTISVDAEVEEVFGPRMFTIDERNWGDLDGEVMVFVPTPLAAVIRDDDLITVTGVVKPFVEVKMDLEREWGWLGLDKELEVEFGKRPVLVASRIVGGDNNAAFIVDTGARAGAVGTSGSAGTKPASGTSPASKGSVSDIGTLADAGDSTVGRDVMLNNVSVHAMAKDGGFFAKAGNNLMFVLPMSDAGVSQGQTVSLEGVILAMPRHMRDNLNAPKDGNVNPDVYIYATRVNRR